jgi:hypothetical protein
MTVPKQREVPRLLSGKTGARFLCKRPGAPRSRPCALYSTNTSPNPNQVDASRAFGSTLDREDLDTVFHHSAQEVGRR